MKSIAKKENNNYYISEKEQKYIQIIKVILCFLVILLHSFREEPLENIKTIISSVPSMMYFVKYLVSHIICKCAVPGFFIISSILLYRKEYIWKDNIKKKIRTLLIPYLLFNTFWIIFYFVVQKIPQFSQYFSTESTIVSNWKLIDWINAYTGIYGYPMLYPLWFIRDLFILNIISPFIKKCSDKLSYFIILIFLIIYIINYKMPFLILNYESLLFFTIGYFIVKKDIHIYDIEKTKGLIVVITYIFLVVVYCVVEGDLIRRILMLFIITISLLIICKSCIKLKYNLNEKIIKIAPYSFSIYLFHEFLLTILIKICNIFVIKNKMLDILEYFILPIIVFILCLVISKTIKKYIPKIYNIIVGNRAM